jgi:hypothetical protein
MRISKPTKLIKTSRQLLLTKYSVTVLIKTLERMRQLLGVGRRRKMAGDEGHHRALEVLRLLEVFDVR